MSLLSFFRRRSSAPVARERLQILLAHERALTAGGRLVAMLQEEILAVIAQAHADRARQGADQARPRRRDLDAGDRHRDAGRRVRRAELNADAGLTCAAASADCSLLFVPVSLWRETACTGCFRVRAGARAAGGRGVLITILERTLYGRVARRHNGVSRQRGDRALWFRLLLIAVGISVVAAAALLILPGKPGPEGANVSPSAVTPSPAPGTTGG